MHQTTDIDERDKLVRPRIARHAIPREYKMQLSCLNIRSVNNKIDDVRDLVQDRNIDVLTLCEPWHEDADCVTTKRLRSLGFNVLETARPIDSKKSDSVNFVNHGGVAVIARHGFSIAKIDLKTKVVTLA